MPESFKRTNKTSLGRWIFLISFLLLFSLIGLSLVIGYTKDLHNYTRAVSHQVSVGDTISTIDCLRPSGPKAAIYSYRVTELGSSSNLTRTYDLRCIKVSHQPGEMLQVYVIPGSITAYPSKEAILNGHLVGVASGIICLLIAGYFVYEIKQSR